MAIFGKNFEKKKHPPLAVFIKTFYVNQNYQVYNQQMNKYFLWIVAICFLSSTPTLSLNQSPETPFLYKSFSGFNPGAAYDIGALTSTDSIKITLTWTNSVPSILRLFSYSGSAWSHIPIVPGDIISSTPSFVIQKTPGTSSKLMAVVQSAGRFTQFNIQILKNGARIVSKSGIALANFHFSVHKITIYKRCKLKIVLAFGGTENRLLAIDAGTGPITIARENQLIFTFPTTGSFYIVFAKGYGLSQPIQEPIPYSINVYTFCDNFCVNSFAEQQKRCYTPAVCGNGILQEGEQCDNGNTDGCTACLIGRGYKCLGIINNPSICSKIPICGNGIKEVGQECDNGNKTGCTDCVIDRGYDCYGNQAGTSICSSYPRCGNGIVEKGQQCDNGNQLGCSSNCVVDSGYNCSGAIGQSSSCAFCGNGIVEVGQECDNKNKVGCSSGCRIDLGFDCRGASSNCFRKNSVCGNNVIEIVESCDDGNKDDGDGCSHNCLIEQGYYCSGQFGQYSKCQKDSTPPVSVCGNGKFQGGEQCDNGNQAGCLNCIIQEGWECANLLGYRSMCKIKAIVVSYCGNRVLEPSIGEICDDGNIADGDGCSSFCQVEFGWVCIDNKKCFNLQDPQLNIFCGNGKLELAFGQACDDGNKENGDGCDRLCKVQAGWRCQLSSLTNKSQCIRWNSKTFCGNGIKEDGQTCDDGFPLKKGDGCTIDCQIEQGWNCLGSLCWKA